MNIEEAIEKLKRQITVGKCEKNIGIPVYISNLETLLTAYEKEKDKNKELSNSYDKLAKECNEENRRCMLLAVENQDLKEKNKQLNLVRLQYLVSSFPDTTETHKKYKKELDELLKEE